MKTRELADKLSSLILNAAPEPTAFAAAVNQVRHEVDAFETSRRDKKGQDACSSNTVWDTVLLKVGATLRKPLAVPLLRQAHPGLGARAPLALVLAQRERRLAEAGPETVWCAVAGARYPLNVERLQTFSGSWLGTLLGAAVGDGGAFRRPTRNKDGDVVVDGISQHQFDFLHQFVQEGEIAGLTGDSWREARAVAVNFGPQEMLDYLDSVAFPHLGKPALWPSKECSDEERKALIESLRRAVERTDTGSVNDWRVGWIDGQQFSLLCKQRAELQRLGQALTFQQYLLETQGLKDDAMNALVLPEARNLMLKPEDDVVLQGLHQYCLEKFGEEWPPNTSDEICDVFSLVQNTRMELKKQQAIRRATFHIEANQQRIDQLKDKLQSHPLED